MKRNGAGLYIFSLLVVVGLLFSGCHKKEDTFTVSTPGGKMTVKADGSGQGALQIEGKDGKTTVVVGQRGGTVTEAQLGVPVYPGVTVKGSSKMEGTAAGGKGAVEMYTLSSQDSFDKVAEFYKSNLKDVKSNFVQGSGDKGMAVFSLGEDGAITVNVVAEGKNGTTIQVVKKTK